MFMADNIDHRISDHHHIRVFNKIWSAWKENIFWLIFGFSFSYHMMITFFQWLFLKKWYKTLINNNNIISSIIIINEY